MSKKKKDWKTEKGKACFERGVEGGEAITLSMADSMNSNHAVRLTATLHVFSSLLRRDFIQTIP